MSIGSLDDFHQQLLNAPEVAVIKRRKARSRAWSSVRGTIARLAVFVIAAWLVFSHVFGIYRIPDAGMSPTAGDGDLALIFRLDKSLKSDDVVVYKTDDAQGASSNGGYHIGRVVAQPGDSVEVTDDGELKVNGNSQPSKSGQATEPQGGSVTYPLTLGNDEYFVLGDGRQQATDSRTYGAIGINEVEGKVVSVLRLRQI